MNLKIIDYKFWVNTVTKATASITGAVPWVTSSDEKNWKIKTKGYTIEFTASDGTVTRGTGYKPFTTLAEAEAYCTKYKQIRNLA